MYRIEFNTGNANWNSIPIVVECNTLEEVKEEIKEVLFGQDKLTEENIFNLEKGELIYDDSEKVWSIEKI